MYITIMNTHQNMKKYLYLTLIDLGDKFTQFHY